MLIAFVLAGCVSENVYWRKLPRIECDRGVECDPEGFDEAYDDEADCEDAVAAIHDTWRETYENFGCVFDGGAARQCLRDKRTASCEDYQTSNIEACDEVYTCDDDDEG